MVSRNFLSGRTAFVSAPVPGVGSARFWETGRPGGWGANSWELAARGCSGESVVAHGQTVQNENQMWKSSAQRTYLHVANSHPLHKPMVNIETLKFSSKLIFWISPNYHLILKQDEKCTQTIMWCLFPPISSAAVLILLTFIFQECTGNSWFIWKEQSCENQSVILRLGRQHHILHVQERNIISGFY